jgi:hypothetical protein
MTNFSQRAQILASLAWLVVSAASSQAADPRAAPGKPTEGTPIVVLSTGIDYTRPEIAAHLARDGEGELIAADAAGNDRTPYAASPNETPAAWGGDGTTMLNAIIAAAATANAKYVFIPVRIDPADPVSVAKALAFTSFTPAKIVLAPVSVPDAKGWDGLKAATEKFSAIKVVVPDCGMAADGKTAAGYPAALGVATITTPKREPDLAWLGGVLDAACAPVAAPVPPPATP